MAIDRCVIVETLQLSMAYPVPDLPFKLWHVIIELALGRRTMSRFGRKSAWLPRSKQAMLDARELIRNLRLVNQTFRRLVDDCIVQTITIAPKSNWPSHETFAIVQRFRQAQTLLISSQQQAFVDAVTLAIDLMRFRLPDGHKPVLISDMKMTANQAFPFPFNIYKILTADETSLRPRSANVRPVGDSLHFCSLRQHLNVMWNQAAQAIWLADWHFPLEVITSHIACCADLCIACEQLYVHFRQPDFVLPCHIENLRLMAAAMPRLRELHVVAKYIRTAALDEIIRFREEIDGRFEILMHTYSYEAIRTLLRRDELYHICCPECAHESGLTRYFFGDAEALIDSAHLTGRFAQ